MNTETNTNIINIGSDTDIVSVLVQPYYVHTYLAAYIMTREQSKRN